MKSRFLSRNPGPGIMLALGQWIQSVGRSSMNQNNRKVNESKQVEGQWIKTDGRSL